MSNLQFDTMPGPNFVKNKGCAVTKLTELSFNVDGPILTLARVCVCVWGGGGGGGGVGGGVLK